MYIALKEIRRSAGRFLLLTTAVGLLVLLLLFFQAVGGALTGGLTGAVDRSRADVLVYDERARRNPSASVLDPAVVDAVAAVDGVAATSPIAITIATGAIDGEDVDVALFGGDPTGPSVPRDIAEGRLPETAGEALASSSALEEGFAVGDVIEVAGQRIEVVGTADDAAFNVLPTLYVPLEAVTAIVQARAGAPVEVPPSLVGVAVDEGADPVTVAQAITADVPGVDALDRDTAVAELPGVGTVTQSFSILYLLLFIVVTIVTGVFFLILTVQKRDALVLLRAVGGGRRDVLVPVLVQVLLVTGVGAVGGALVAGGLLAAARDVFGTGLDPATAATTVAGIIALGLLASVGAVRRIQAIDPVEATTPGAL